MTAKDIERGLDMQYYRLSKKDALSLHEYEILQRTNKLRYYLLSNHALTLAQRAEAMLLLNNVLLKEVNDKRKKNKVDKAIQAAYPAFTWLGPTGFADLIGAKRERTFQAIRQINKQRA